MTVVRSKATAAAAAAAAAARTESTRRRVIELQQRVERLRAGQLPNREDVIRARTAAAAQRRALAAVQRRMIQARTPMPPLAVGTANSAATSDRYERLRDALVSLVSSSLDDTQSQHDDERRRRFATALVERAPGPASNWTEALCQLSLEVLSTTIGSAVSTYDEFGVSHPFAAADDRSLELEELQQVAGEGPGHDVQVDKLPVLLDDLTQQDIRWPGYVATVRGHGIGAIWSLPVWIGTTVLGTLTLYHGVGSSPRHCELPEAMTLAALGAAAMVIDADTHDGCAGDRRAEDTVSLASGMLAVRAGVDVDQALALLRGYAFSTGRRISDIAADVLAERVDLG